MSNLKQRIFGNVEFSLEEILESLVNTEEKTVIIPFEETEKIEKPIEELEEQILVPKDIKFNIILYEFSKNNYLVYVRDEEEDESYEKQDTNYGLFVPTGVNVRRVPQNVLGNGILGRAFIHSNYIEILDSLLGHEYTEVLTHEVLHIMHPEKREQEIRQMTRNYLGANNTVYH